MFDTMETAKRIRNARIKKNMTQTALADVLGVSYQAVSNWERGNSMPDISKLNDLCSALDITLDELLGSDSRETRAIKSITGDGSETSFQSQITLSDIASVSPILSPSAMKSEIRKTIEKKGGSNVSENAETVSRCIGERDPKRINSETLFELAPFISDDAWETMAENGDLSDLGSEALNIIAPFLTDDAWKIMAENGDLSDIGSEKLNAVAPFISDDAWETMAENGDLSDLGSEALNIIAPFLTDDAWEIMAENGDLSDLGSEKLNAVAPFIPSDVLKIIFKSRSED